MNTSTNEYIVLMVEHNDEGTIIAGIAPPEHIYVMPGQFYYNKDLVHSQFGDSVDNAPGYPEMNNSIKILLGIYYNQLREGSQYGHLVVSGIYSYPYQLENGPTILGNDRNGTVLIAYNNSSVNLKVNDIWKSQVVSIKTKTYNESYADINGNVYNSTKNYSYTVMWETTWTIKNVGKYPI